MKIVADENIARLADHFGWAGELVTLPGRAIDAAAVRDADVLLVRSVTRVDADLLAASRCRFVGTATSGVDHVDVGYLQQQGIGLGWARGCNADSVVEYVFSALASLSALYGFDWRQRSVGIAGCGEIGSRLARKLLSLHIPVKIHDPFLPPDHPLAAHFASLDEVICQDVLSFHTPLTRDGKWPTWHLIDETRLAMLSPNAILINTSRGAVVDNQALLASLRRQPQQPVVLDAWEEEPDINRDLLQRVAIATPHIAGYSREGKLQGTRMIAADFCGYFDLTSPLPQPVHDAVRLLHADPASPPLAQINSVIRDAYDVMTDHLAMQTLLSVDNTGAHFDQLRKAYPLRPSFSDFCVSTDGLHADIVEQVRALGFQVQP